MKVGLGGARDPFSVGCGGCCVFGWCGWLGGD